MRWIALGLLLAIAGCTTPRLYDGEPVDKSNASLIRGQSIKALIRPVGADQSVEARITDDGIWVSKGSFVVRYMCLQADQDPTNLPPGYPHEKTIHIEAGYHYQVNCYDSKDQIGDEMKLENDSWEDVDYHTFAEALYEVPEHVRYDGGLWQENTFRYEYYNDWGGEGDVIFTISRAPMSGEFSAELSEYKYSVANQAIALYDKGVRTEKEMESRLEKVSYVGSASECPKLQSYYDRMFGLMKAKAASLVEAGPMLLYTDSPPIYHYYFSNGPNEMLTLEIMDVKDDLYNSTQDAMSYLRTCGKKGN